MFALIITIISIALVAALALATIYYGGTAFNRGTAEAKASQLINEGQQINGAVALAQADIDRDGLTTVVDADTLVSGNYLSQMPADWFLGDISAVDTLGTGVKALYAVHLTDGLSTAALEQIAKKAGYPLVGSTADAMLDTTETAGTTLKPTNIPSTVFGIVGKVATDGSGSLNAGKIFYKL